MELDENGEMAKKMEQVLASAGRPGFIIYGWKKDDGTYGFVQSLKEMDLMAYYQGVSALMSNVVPKQQQ